MKTATKEMPIMLLDAVVALENAPHPAECEVYLEDGCTCGLDVVLARLWPIVGADDAEGDVPDGHALQAARRNSVDSRVRAALALAAEFGDGVSPECSLFADSLRRALTPASPLKDKSAQ